MMGAFLFDVERCSLCICSELSSSASTTLFLPYIVRTYQKMLFFRDMICYLARYSFCLMACVVALLHRSGFEPKNDKLLSFVHNVLPTFVASLRYDHFYSVLPTFTGRFAPPFRFQAYKRQAVVVCSQCIAHLSGLFETTLRFRA